MWGWPTIHFTEKVSTGIRPAPDALDGFLFPARMVQENHTMTTPQSNPDEPIPPTITPSQSVEESKEIVTGETTSHSKSQPTTISLERLAARERLAKKWPRPPWALKAGTVVVTTTLSPQSITPSHWTLTFHSGMKVARPTLARLVAAIENLQPDEADRNGFVILETTRSAGSSAIFMQACCYKQGIYFVEIGENKPVNGPLSSLLKAGRREAAGAVVCESDVKTYENECLSTEEVIAIAEHFFKQQEYHPNFQWRSIREDVRAFHQKSRKQPSSQDKGQQP